jgi:hypothetical protein
VPRRHGNKGKLPPNAFNFVVVERAVRFLNRYAELYGLPQPAPSGARQATPITFLPAKTTKKSVHEEYVRASTETMKIS